jgi:hypothetical protein
MGKVKIAVTIAALAALGWLYGCVTARLPNVPLQVQGEAASPAVLGAFQNDPPVSAAEDWTTRRAPLLREAFQTHIYGRFPDAIPVSVTARTPLDASAFNGAAVMEQWDVQLGEAQEGRGFGLLLVLPAHAQGPVPVIIMQNFCGNAAVYPNIAGIAGPRSAGPGECGSGLMRPVISLIFGDAIMTPPTLEILNAGYGLAMMYGGDIAPDSADAAEPALQGLTPAGTPPDQRTGAIAAWAFGYLRAMEAISADPRVRGDQIVLWGHSRNGKAALLAAALDARPAAVIALQAGTAGGSLGRDAVGESIPQIIGTYPHWFAPAYAAYAGREAELPVDQHQLIALIAPRPVLLAGARRDQWSDPIGAVRAAQGASAAYELFGAAPFLQEDLREGVYDRPLATYMRGGLHGVHGSDWEEAIAFLDARLRGR